MNDPVKLHIGSGSAPLAGWINIDILEQPGVDQIVDVTRGLPFEDVSFIFAEHFIEHLTLREGIRFLEECRRVLNHQGVIRLSTPNLDWVWSTHYGPPNLMTPQQALQGCLEINRAFHGWGHQFLYNIRVLSDALSGAGFSQIEPREYGASDHDVLRNLEQHPPGDDLPGLPHVSHRRSVRREAAN